MHNNEELNGNLALGSFLAKLELTDVQHHICQIAWQMLSRHKNDSFIILVITPSTAPKMRKFCNVRSSEIMVAKNNISEEIPIRFARWRIQRQLLTLCNESDDNIIRIKPPEGFAKVYFVHGIGFTAFAVKAKAVMN